MSREREKYYLKKLLLRKMEDLSEETYCAGWMTGWEHTLWELVFGGVSIETHWGTWIQRDVEEIKELAELTGSWFCWENNLGRQVEITLEAFNAKHELRKASK